MLFVSETGALIIKTVSTESFMTLSFDPNIISKTVSLDANIFLISTM